ncbi:MAG: TIGR04255 family protein [Oscillospiraceae bacterium]
MLFSEADRCRYAHPAAHEVICQLRFPTILRIDNREPADFQELIRGSFPRYALRREAPPARVVQRPGAAPELQTPPAVANYSFISEDTLWKLNLTKDFIALSTLRYTGWEDFAARLDQTLAAFIRIYQPAFFERIGLRYRNILSRGALGLEDRPWRELLHPAYLGALAEEDVPETEVRRCAVDLELSLSGSCHAKIHAEPVHLKPANGGAPEAEQKFILDIDLSMQGNLAAHLAAGALETLHGHSTRVFRGAITEELHEAMGPSRV